MSSDEEGLLQQALCFEGNDNEFDLDVPPTSGHEYLRRVQLEAKSCPQIVVAEIDRKKYFKRQNIGVKSTSSGLLPAPSGLAPHLWWQHQQCSKFSEVRQKLFCYKEQVKKDCLKPYITLPRKDDVQSWCRLCFGQYMGPGTHSGNPESDNEDQANEQTTSAAEMRNNQQKMPPVLSIICHLDQATVLKLLEYHVNWFEATGFTHEQGQWFYALLSSLEKPLSPETCSLLRNLARNCANLRATLDHNSEILQPLNLFICLVARYFDQLDLADQT